MGSRDAIGQLRAPQRAVRLLPKKGKIKTYILTSAQNNTGLHETCWANLQALAKHTGAEIMVASFTYTVASMAAKGQKKTAKESTDESEWWDDRLTPFLCDESVQLAPGLVWCGELQILPTAVNPTSGRESYTGRDSCILPHVKFHVRSVASPKNSGTKFVYTSGTVTLRNYIQKSAGQKASFHHGYGAVIVEVRDDGSWFVRQLNADSEGVIYDLDRRVSCGKVTLGHRPEALVWGDIHVRQLEPHMLALGWGSGGMLDALRPKRQVLHDVLDMRSQNHHDRDDPWKTYAKHVVRGLNVEDEVAEAADFIEAAARPWCDTDVVCSNHDMAFVRWCKEADFRRDPLNAPFLLAAHTAAYAAMQKQDTTFYPVEWAFRRTGRKMPKTRFVRRDEERIVCPDAAGGIELGMHGDKGPNGAAGGLPAFARTGRKCIVGHSHSAGMHEGATQVGVMGSLDMGYNEGQSSWSHTNAVVYPNGKRALITIWKGRWRA